MTKIPIRSYISIVTLTVNGINAPTKRQRLVKDTKTRHAIFKRPTSDLGAQTD